MINPIIDWTDEDVWEFLNYYGCKSNPLYYQGYTRVGCVGCPMNCHRAEELEQYPAYKQAYIHAFQRMVDYHDYSATSNIWKNGEAVYQWWIQKNFNCKPLEGQMELEL